MSEVRFYLASPWFHWLPVTIEFRHWKHLGSVIWTTRNITANDGRWNIDIDRAECLMLAVTSIVRFMQLGLITKLVPSWSHGYLILLLCHSNLVCTVSLPFHWYSNSLQGSSHKLCNIGRFKYRDHLRTFWDNFISYQRFALSKLLLEGIMQIRQFLEISN